MTRFLLSLAALCMFSAPIVSAEEPANDATAKGLCAGDDVGAFLVTKVAGAANDDVDDGATLCYRCKYGQRPMVMIFTRTTDGSVSKLIEQVDAAVAKHSKDELKGLVTLIGSEPTKLTTQGKAMASKLKDKNIPIVVAKDTKNGPASYKLDAKTDVTVVLVNQSQVVSRHDFAADKVDVAEVMKQVNEMLN